MPTFQPVKRRSVADAVHDELRRAIFAGEIAPGDALPGERALGEQFGVNRHALREALKRLAQVGLLEVHHGGATRVCDWRRTAGLDVLPDLAVTVPSAFADAARMRLAIGEDVARLAAAARADLPAREATAEGYEQLWRDLVDSSQNVAYRLALNALQAATHRLGEEFPRLSAAEWQDVPAQDALRAAVAAGDEDGAAAAARDLLRRTLEAVR